MNNSMPSRLTSVPLALLILSGCVSLDSYPDSIELSAAAESVVFSNDELVRDCDLLGPVRGSARATSVQSAVDMAILASRNKAAAVGGNSIVFHESHYDEHVFYALIDIDANAYRCKNVIAGDDMTDEAISAETKAVAAAHQQAATLALQRAQEASMQRAHEAAMKHAERAHRAASGGR